MSQRNRNSVEQSFPSSSSSSTSSSNNSPQQPSNTTTVSPPDVKTQNSAISLSDLKPERRALVDALFTSAKKDDAKLVESLIKQGVPQLEARTTEKLREGLLSLQQAKILTQGNFTALLKHAQHAEGLGNGLSDLQGAKILTQENFAALLNHAPHAKSLGLGLAALQRAKILTPENRSALLDHVQHAWGLGECLYILQDEGILTPGNRQALLDHAQHTKGLHDGLIYLCRAELLTPANFTALLTHAEHAATLADELRCLQQDKKLTQENFVALLARYQPAAGLNQKTASLQEMKTASLENREPMLESKQQLNTNSQVSSGSNFSFSTTPFSLNTSSSSSSQTTTGPAASTKLETKGKGSAVNLEDPSPENQASFKQLYAAVASGNAKDIEELIKKGVPLLAAHAREIRGALVSLQGAGILTSENFTALLDHAEHPFLGDVLMLLQQAGILTPANFTALLKHAEYAGGLGRGLAVLQGAGILTSENFTALLDHASYADGMSSGLAVLQRDGILTSESFIGFLTHVEGLGRGLVSLQDAGILTPENRQALLEHAAHNKDLGYGLFILQLAGILTQENFTALLKHTQHAAALAHELEQLWENEELTQQNFIALLERYQPVARLSQKAASLQEARASSLENREPLLESKQQPETSSQVSSSSSQTTAGPVAFTKPDEKKQSSTISLSDLTSEHRALIEALFTAVGKGDAKEVQNLIKQGAPLNVKNADGKTPLFIAARGGHHEVVITLLATVEGRAMVNQTTPDGITPLWIATVKGYPEVVTALLMTAEGRATVNQTTPDGITPLGSAAWGGHFDIAVALLRHGANFKEAKNDLTRASQQEGLSAAETKKNAKALANLTLINELYHAELAASALSKAETKHEQDGDVSTISSLEDSSNRVLSSSFTSSNSNFSSGSSSQTTTTVPLTASSSETTIRQIKNDLAEGNTEALLNYLRQPAGGLAADSNIQAYLEQQALTDIIKAQAQDSEKAELKDSQQDNLIKAMEEILKADPVAVLRLNEANGLTPLDVAAQLELPKKTIDRLQCAERDEYDRQDKAFWGELEALAQSSQVKPEDKQACAELALSMNEVDKQLDALRKQLSRLQSGVSVPLPPVPTPVTNSAMPLTSTPVALSAAQKDQIDLGRQLLNIKLTQVFTKGLAIKYKLVDAHNQSRTSTVVSGFIMLAGALVPLPGASLLAKGVVEVGKLAFRKAVKGEVEKRNVKRQHQRLDEIETIDQAAERIAALVKDLTRRFQLVFAQLNPESLEVFVDRVVVRMVHYWDAVAEKIEKAELDREVLCEGLVDCMQPKPPKPAGKALSEGEQFDNLIENMVLGASLWKDRDAKASGRVAKRAAGNGKVAKIATFVVGDRPVYYQSAQGPQEAMVQQICRDAPVVTWKGEKDSSDNPIYRYGRAAPNGQPLSVAKSMPSVYLSEAECELRDYKIDRSTTVVFDVLMPPKEFELTKSERLERELEVTRRELEVERARRSSAEARAAAAERETELERARAGVAELKLTDIRASLQHAQTTPVRPQPTHTRGGSGSGMFDHKPLPSGQPPASSQTTSSPPSGSVSVTSPVGGGGLGS